MQPFPTLKPNARKLLEIVVGNPSIDGSTLMKHMSISSADIVSAIRDLQTQKLIEVGGTLSEDTLPFTRIGVRPSAKDYLYSLLQNSA